MAVTYVDAYTSVEGLQALFNGDYNNSDKIKGFMSTHTNGIEGLPYQFMDSVDRRLNGTNIGRKYGDRIFSKIPLLFLTPCEPLFMDDFSNSQKSIVKAALGGNINLEGLSDIFTESKKYYSVEFAYKEYYNMLNPMLASVAYFMGIQDEVIDVGDRKGIPIKNVSWQNELNDDFKSFFASEENLIFFVDSLDTVSESFTNETTESSLSGIINGIGEYVNEIKFLFGKGGATSILSDLATGAAETLGSGLSSLGAGLAGGIVGSLLKDGTDTVLNGGKIIFPKIWSNSSFDRSYQLDFKLRSPDHDNISIFLNIIKPYCKLLALTLPREMDSGDPNSYRSPFLVRAAAKGMFNIDMGIISSMSVNKGANCQWNDDGLPTQIDISITVEDLYSSIHMSGFGNQLNPITKLFHDIFGNNDSAATMVNNTAYMDFLANMAGLNIAQMESGRRIKMWNYLTARDFARTGSQVRTTWDSFVGGIVQNAWDVPIIGNIVGAAVGQPGNR